MERVLYRWGNDFRCKTLVIKERAEVRNTQTCNASEASASSHGFPKIRGSRWQMRDEMRRRPGQVGLALSLSGEHLQIAALLGVAKPRDRDVPLNHRSLVTRPAALPPPPKEPRLHLPHLKFIHSVPVHFCKEVALCRVCKVNWNGSSHVPFRLKLPRRIVFLIFQGFISLHAFLFRFKRHRSRPRPAYAVAVEIQTGSPPTLERKE